MDVRLGIGFHHMESAFHAAGKIAPLATALASHCILHIQENGPLSLAAHSVTLAHEVSRCGSQIAPFKVQLAVWE